MGLLGRGVRRLGRTFGDALTSREGLRRLPTEIGTLTGAAWRRLRRGGADGFTPEERARALAVLSSDGVDGLLRRFDAERVPPHRAAALLTALARASQDTDLPQAVALARAAHRRDPQPFRAKWLAFRLWDLGAIEEPARLLAPFTVRDLSLSEQRRREQILASQELRDALPGWEEGDAPPYEPDTASLLYVAAMALPYHGAGYATRTQAFARALQAQGVQPTVLTRPGYPWDRPDRNGQPQGNESWVDGVRYRHFRRPSRELPFDRYLHDATKVVGAEAIRCRAARITAASNAENALPALIAARELGIPFTYEMRGLWELSRAASHAGYDRSERFALNMALERHVAIHADEVRVISEPVRRQALEWGVEPERIALLPNCVGGVPASPPTDDEWVAGRLNLVYTGTVLAYEGLPRLVQAMRLLRDEGLDLRLTVAGDGKGLDALREAVAASGLETAVTLLGRVAPEQVEPLVARADAVALPRLDLPVCSAVPPIKLVEAMALGKPVVVPDLPVFRDEVDDGVDGLTFRPDDTRALADALRRLALDPALRRRLGHAARERAARSRTWTPFAAEVAQALVSGRQVAPPPSRVPPASARRIRARRQDDPLDLLLAAAQSGDPAALRQQAQRLIAGSSGRSAAATLLRAARALGQAGAGEAEGALALMALRHDGGDSTLRAFFWSAQRARLFEEALDALRRIETLYGAEPTPEQREFLDKLQRSPVQQLRVLDLVATAPVDPPTPVPGRVAYVLHNSLPYSSGGYGTRSHGVATGLRAAGREVVALTRPGFPLDIKPELTAADVPAEDVVEDLRYLRTLEPQRSGLTLREYVTRSADAMESRLRELRPEVVVAASNHLTALPALIAARRLGVPFCYEVRGLWEITRMSRDAEFHESSAFTVQRLLEARVAAEAAHVFTLTEPMREELIERGVPAERIDLLPNSCDPERFEPRSRDQALAARLGIAPEVPVIGYVGTFVDYEGLEDLAAACAQLKDRGHVFRLLLVGNENASGTDRGPITQQIVDIATAADMQDWVLLPGRVPYEEVESWYSLIDIAPFPRKPWPVCEMVSPMKPLEALAMEKAVVVSDVRALGEMIRDGETGLWFRKGDTGSLADVLERLLASPELRSRLGREGRRWVARERTWRAVGARLADRLSTIASPPR